MSVKNVDAEDAQILVNAAFYSVVRAQKRLEAVVELLPPFRMDDESEHEQKYAVSQLQNAINHAFLSLCDLTSDDEE